MEAFALKHRLHTFSISVLSGFHDLAVSRRLCCLACVLALALQAMACAADAPSKPGKTVRLLTVGNSFSGNASHYLNDIVKAAGNVLVYRTASIGGGSMQQHWDKAQQHEKDAADPQGLYTTKRSLKQELLAEPWDFVTIQQASIKSHDLSTYQPYSGQLYAYIKRYAPKAEVLVHETWPYRCDDPRFSEASPKPGEPVTQQAMYEGLRKAYATIAAELRVRIIPVGDAFQRANSDPQWGYRPDKTFDFKAAQPPALPNQAHSLNVGWRWAKGKDGRSKLGMDGHHANTAGEYLGGCVFYETLYADSVVGNPFVPPGLDANYVRFLQQTAHDVVASLTAQK
jgi:hypothetical protein